MYIHISKKKTAGKTYEYYQLIESQRVGAKVRKRVVSSLGRRDDPRSVASYIFQQNTIMTSLTKQKAKLYALPTAIYSVCKKDLILSSIFQKVFASSKIAIDVWLLTVLMIIHRIIDPDSKLSLTRWYKNIMLPASLPESIDVSHFYYTLDYLLKKKEEIEKQLFQRLIDKGFIDAAIVFYDLTSSYFEGDEVEMSAKGHSRDYRPDRPQITLGLVIDKKNGLPIYHDVYEGNMSDSKTVRGILNKLEEMFHLKDIVFVADKGMLSPDNIQALEEKHYQSILSESVRNALSQKQREELFLQIDTFKKLKGLEETLWYKETKDKNGKDIIICYNQYTAQKAKETRDSRLKKIEKFINDAKEKHPEIQKQSTKKPEKTEMQIVRDMIFAKLVSSHTRKYFDPKDKQRIDDLFPLLPKVVVRDEYIDGMWVIRNKTTSLTTEELIMTYKDLKIIEASFRTIKDVIELRPIYHHKNNRVKGHIFICILAFLVTRLLEQKAGKTIKMIREEHVASVAIPATADMTKPIIFGGSDLLKAVL